MRKRTQARRGIGHPPRPRARLAQALALTLLLCGAPVAAQSDAPGDAIDAPLQGLAGDPARGRAIVADRSRGLCLLCHAGPFPEERAQGDLAPDLAGAGSRWTEGQLRLRIVDGRRLDPASIMPAYHRTEGLVRVAPALRGRPILDAQQVEDVVAFLATLREPAHGAAAPRRSGAAATGASR